MDQQLKSDFPVDWEEDHYVSRREFVKFMTLASGGLAVGTAGLAVWAHTPRDHRTFEAALIAKVADVPVGQALAFSYPQPRDLCILVHSREGEFRAYSRRCTHLSCPVEFQPEHHRLYCPCHNGAFSLEDGHVLQGPPPRPLPEIMLEIRGDEIHAVGVKKAEA